MRRVLAADIGGSRTSALLIEDGAVVAQRRGPGANLSWVGPEAVAKLVAHLARDFDFPEAIAVGVAGLRTQTERRSLVSALRESGLLSPLALFSDAQCAMRAAEVRSGILLIAGTGSIALGVDERGRQHRAGGWGWTLGDEGSAAWIGLQAVRAVVRASDERGTCGSLTDALLEELGMSDVDELRALNRAAPASLAALLPAVLRALEQGDDMAEQIVLEAAAELTRLVRLVARDTELPAPITVVLSGGAVEAVKSLTPLIQQKLGDGYAVKRLEADPALGAYWLATETDCWDRSRSSERLLPTEAANPASEVLDRLPTIEVLRIMNAEDARVAPAIAERLDRIAQLVDAVVARMESGGRLIYVGAGTSGRLGVLDAAECPPTFGIEPGRVIALLAGGAAAMMRAVEGAEDDGAAGREAIRAANVSDQDAVLGISASGRAAFVREAVAEARSRGAFTGFLTAGGEAGEADVVVSVPVGPEVISGSTRLKAATAQKMILNMISTATMVRLGRTLGNRMVGVQPTNAKLRDRATRLVMSLSDADEATARDALCRTGWDVTRASLLARLGTEAAVEEVLTEHGGNPAVALRHVIMPPE